MDRNGISHENFAQLRDLAVNVDKRKIVEQVDQFVQKNFEEIRHSETFLGLSSDYLKQILESSSLKVTNESDVLESVLRWVGKDKQRQSELPKLMECVRLDHLENDELWKIAEKKGVLSKKETECQKQIHGALKRKFVIRSGEKSVGEAKVMHPRYSTSGLLMVAGGGKGNNIADVGSSDFKGGSETFLWGVGVSHSLPQYTYLV